MEEKTSEGKDCNFITSLVAHCVTAAVAADTAETPAVAVVVPDKPAEEIVAASKEEPKVEPKQDAKPEVKEAPKPATAEQPKVDTNDPNFMTSMVAHRVVSQDSESKDASNAAPTPKIEDTKKEESKKEEVKKEEVKKVETKPEVPTVVKSVPYEESNKFAFIPSMVSHFVTSFPPKDLPLPAAVGQPAKSVGSNESGKDTKPTQSEVKENQAVDNADKNVRNVTAGDTPAAKKGKSKQPKEISAETLAALEKSWDVSQDLDLAKVLNKARLLGAAKPAPLPQQKPPPKFAISVDKLARMENPVGRIEACRATLLRNLAAFPSKELSSSERLDLERLIKKIMGISFMPEDITGYYEYMSKKHPREQMKVFDKEVIFNSGDVQCRDPPVKEWKEGSGIYFNNYENLIIKTNTGKDQLIITSAESGHDIRSVVVRLKKAIDLIEDTIRAVTGKGFQHKDEAFIHSNKHLFSHGFDLSFIVNYPGFSKEEEKYIKNFGIKHGLNATKYGKRSGLYELTVSQKPEDTIGAIIHRAIQGVNEMGQEEDSLLKKHNINLDNLHED